MNENNRPTDDVDEVEGHGLSAREIEMPEPDDVEGHGFRGNIHPRSRPTT